MRLACVLPASSGNCACIFARHRGHLMNALNPKVLLAASLIGALLLNSALAAPFRLIKDVYPGTASGVDFYHLVASGDHLFFWGTDGVDGAAGQPWRSDGTTSGTAQIGVFLGSSGAYYDGGSFVYQGITYFLANDGFHGKQLWRSDGTAPGTFALTSVTNASTYPFCGYVGIYNRVVFVGQGSSGTQVLWSTDGT